MTIRWAPVSILGDQNWAATVLLVKDGNKWWNSFSHRYAEALQIVTWKNIRDNWNGTREKLNEDAHAQWCARDIFVESESQAIRFRVIWNLFVSSQSHSHDLVESSQNQVTKTVESLRSLVCKLESMSSHMKFHIFSTRFFMLWNGAQHSNIAPDKLENGAQHAIKWRPIG